MPSLLRAMEGGQTEADETSGPSSYPTGGFSVRSNLGRVDRAMAEIDDLDTGVEVTSVSDDNALIVQAYDKAAGGEIASGTDLSDNTVTHFATRL